MKLTDVFTAEAIALHYTNAASNAIPYLGLGLFPAQKKAGLDLKWLRGANGLPVSLAPSTFDAKAKFRDRVGIAINETQMPFFREGYMVKEADEQEIMRVQDSGDAYAQQVLDNIFRDTQNLVDGADVVPERMRMQLLYPLGGVFGIQIKSNGVDYTYDYDVDGKLKEKHYLKIEGENDKWTNAETCDPIKNLEDALDAQEAESGNRPAVLLMSKGTFNLIKNSKKVQSGVLAQNTTANVNYTSARVQAYVEEELNVSIIIYNKQFKDENGVAHKFYGDNMVAMLPSGTLGSTWYGTTPEERSGTNVSVVNTGVAVHTYTTDHPINTFATASEIVLPSWENAESCYFIEVA